MITSFVCPCGREVLLPGQSPARCLCGRAWALTADLAVREVGAGETLKARLAGAWRALTGR